MRQLHYFVKPIPGNFGVPWAGMVGAMVIEPFLSPLRASLTDLKARDANLFCIELQLII